MGGLAILGLMLVSNLAGGWEDLKVGACLSVPQMQALSHVVDTDIYKGGACNRSYTTEGVRVQERDCGLQLDEGSWSRSMVQHKEAGVFWPSPVPCQISVRSANNFRQEWEALGDANSCDPKDFQVFMQQQESFVTKEFEAGQGKLFLPYPFTVRRTEWLGLGDETVTTCEESNIWLEYTGWGNLKATVKVAGCADRKLTFCRIAKLTASEDASGETCLKIDRLEGC